MKYLVSLFFLLFLFCASSFAQTERISRIVLKNGETLTGKILEYKSGEYLKLQYLGNNIIDIQDSDIADIVFDVNATSDTQTKTPREKKSGTDSAKTLRFQSHNELPIGLGVSKIYGFPYEEFVGRQPNSDVFAGFYTANGIVFKNAFFAGIGLGFYSHKGISEDAQFNSSFSIPFMLDFRYRVLPKKTFSPIVMVATGLVYHEGSLGSFSFNDGVGISVRINDHVNGQLLFTHTYNRYSPQLSVGEGVLKEFYRNIYLNYVGPRLGVSFTL